MSILDDAKKFFKPRSPVGKEPLKTGGEGGDVSASRANADYRLDLALQNLLAIGMEYSPDDIIALRRRARYGDPRWLYSLYDEMTRLGPAPQVLKAREAIKATDTVWKATPVEADEDENTTDPKDKAARLIRDVTEEAWAKWLPDLKSHLSTKYFYGIAAAQVMWKPNAIEGKWSKVTDIRPVPARRFRLDPQTMRFKFLTNPYSFEGPFVDDLQAQGKLIFVEVGADTEPLDQRGLLFQCLIPWAIEQFTVRWRAKRLQNFGMPPVMVKYPKGDPNNKAIADQLADLLANGTRASLPMEMSAELLSAAGSGSRGGDPYETNIEWCERSYDKIILGHSQVSGVQEGAGSRTSSNDAIGLFKDVTNSRAKELDEDLRQQCWYPYVAREFGAEWADDHCPVTESRVFERDNAVELADVVSKLAAAGLGGSMAAEDIVERCTLKVPEDGEMTAAGNVKGEHPAPTEVDAINKATPAGLGQQAHVEVDADGKAVQKIKKQPLPAAGTAPAFGPPQKGQQPAGKGATPGKPGTGPVGVPAAGGAAAAKKKFGSEFYTKRQRFAAAAYAERPAITLTVFGEHIPTDTLVNLESRERYGALKAQATKLLKAARLTGEYELNFGVDSKDVADRLAAELRDDKYGVSVVAFNVVEAAERFYSEDQPRDDNGRWSASGDSPDAKAGRAAEGATRESHHRDAVAYHERAAHALDAVDKISALAHREAANDHRKALATPNAATRNSARTGSRAAHSATRVGAKYAAEGGERFYSESQARDDDGRWAGSGSAERADSPRSHDTAVKHHLAIARHASANEEHERADAHAKAAITHAHASGHPEHADAARSLSRVAHSLDVLAKVPKAGGPLRFTAIEAVETNPSPHPKATKLKIEARIAARVRARLKEQHALAAAEAEQKLAKAE